MYEAFFGLRERPFDLAPNPRFLLLTATHREALANLQYGLTGRKGLTLLLGEAGSGKTTLIRAALAQWEAAGHVVAHLNNPTLTRDEFIEFLTQSFGLPPEAGASKTRFLAELTAFVTARHEEGLITGLLIDEAQSLTNELLEEVRLLVNIETNSDKLFQVILAGQPELAMRLNEPGLRQIKQRVALRCRLATLAVREVAAYVAGRIQVAGGIAGQVFTREAVQLIHDYSGGIPRVISVICDNAMLAGFAADRRPITSDIVEEVCRDFDLRRVNGAIAPGNVAPGVAVHDARPAARPVPVFDAAAVARGSEAAARTPARLVEEPAPQRQGLFGHYSAPNRRRFSFF
jgi:type II secretory pathway predicted ATPase ExeA